MSTPCVAAPGTPTVWTRFRFSIPVVLALSMVLVTGPALAAAYDWPQFGGNAQHSGNNTLERAITPGNVNGLQQLFQIPLPSPADSTPVYLGGVNTPSGPRDLLFLTTSAGHILAVDAHTGAEIWSHQNGPGTCSINSPPPGTTGGPCYTTSSPAVDPNRQFVYSYGLDGFVHKYQVGDGTEITGGGWPELATRKPWQEKSSPALSIATTPGGTYLYVTNGGYPGDRGDYQGHITAVNLATGSQYVFNTLCSNQLNVHFVQSPGGPDCGQTQSAVWARPGVVYDPDKNKIYFSTGNGDFDPAAFDWGDSVLALNPDGTGSGASAGMPLDSYTPTNYADLQASDTDLGSTAPAILPAANVPANSLYKHLAVQSGKDGYLRLLNLDNLSGKGGPGNTGGELASLALPSPVFTEVLSQPAVWVNPADGRIWVIITDNAGLAAYTLTVNGGGMPGLQSQWSTVTTARDSLGSSPLVANGVLFDARPNLIEARDPVTGTQLWSDGGIGDIHWESPMVANGVLYITDGSSQLTAYAIPRLYTVAVEGSDQSLYVDHGSYTNQDSGYTFLGGVLIAAPAVVALPDGSDLYIANSTDHHLWERTDSTGWQPLAGGYCVDNPAATVSGNTLIVSCTGGDHGIYYATAAIPTGGLPFIGSWTPYGGASPFGPALALVNGTPTVFAVGMDNRLYWRTAGQNWTPFANTWCTGHPAAATSGTISYVACHGGDHALWYAYNAGSGWSGFQSLGGGLSDGPAIAGTSSGPMFFAEGSDTAVYKRTLTTGWQYIGGGVLHGVAATAG